MKEETLVARSLAGDLDVYNQLVLEYQNLAYQVAYYLLYDTDAATDAVQYSFVSAFRTLKSFQPGNFRNWLMRIVTNTCCDLLRMQQSRATLRLEALPRGKRHDALQATALHSPLQTANWLEVMQHLVAGIHSLPDDQRVVLVLSDICGLSYAEIDEVCGVAPGIARMCLSQARARMRDSLVQDGCIPSCEFNLH